MASTTPSRVTRDEALWGLTGLLIGLALWIATAMAVPAVALGLSLAAVLGGVERHRRQHGADGDAPSRTPRITSSGSSART
jgi:hypothetical protein